MNGDITVEEFDSDMGNIKFHKPLKISWWELEKNDDGVVVEIFLDDGINWSERFNFNAIVPFSKIHEYSHSGIEDVVRRSVHFDFDHAFFHYYGDPNYTLIHWAIFGNYKNDVTYKEYMAQ